MTQTARRQTFRARVLATLDSASEPMTGHQVAQAAGIRYRQAIFALNALNNMSRVARIGRKSTAMWLRVTPPSDNPALALAEITAMWAKMR